MSANHPTGNSIGDDAYLDLNNDSYNSSEDEDFQLAGEHDDADLSSSDEVADNNTPQQPPQKRRKVSGNTTDKRDQHEVTQLDSGDEVTIRKAKERRRKRKESKSKGSEPREEDIDYDEDEDVGVGGFVKTRAMRSKMQDERKPLAKIDGATVDVDALWERMNASGTNSSSFLSSTREEEIRASDRAKQNRVKEPVQPEKQQQHTLPLEEMVKIKRTYKYAGETITEEKLVPKDSAEAKLFLAEAGGEDMVMYDADGSRFKESTLKLRRPLRKASRFDPNPLGFIKRNWEKQPLVDPATIGDNEAMGPKLNTIEKSRLDWAAYVDQAGIKDELNVHSRAKEGYLGRMDFLGRVEAKRDEGRRNLRLKNL